MAKKDTTDDLDHPLWVEEIGPTSCEGTNDSSRTHVQTLWTADIVMQGAAVGAEGMNQHSSLAACRGGAPMSTVCGMGAVPAESPRVVAQSNYLALLMLSQVTPGELIPMSVDTDDVYAYAVRGEKSIDVVLIDLSEPGTDRPIEWSVGQRRAQAVSELTASSLDAANQGRLRLLEHTDGLPDSVPRGSVIVLRISV